MDGWDLGFHGSSGGRDAYSALREREREPFANGAGISFALTTMPRRARIFHLEDGYSVYVSRRHCEHVRGTKI